MDYSPVSSDNTANLNPEIGRNKVTKTKKSKLQIYLPILVPCLLAILILGILAGIWHSQLKTCKKHCETIDCITTSGVMLQMTNLKADPCVDFYEFACGKFNSNALLKPESGILTSYSELLEENLLKMYKLLTDNNFLLNGVNSSAVSKVKSLFSSCMNIEEIENQGEKSLLEFITKMKGWPLLEGDAWNESNWNLTDAVISANKLGIYPFMKYSVLPNFLNSSELEIKFLDSDLSYENKKIYAMLDEDGGIEYKQNLMNYISTVARLLGNNENVSEEVEEIWDLEEKIGCMTIYLALNQTSHITQINRTTVGKANEILGDWINLETSLSDVFGQKISSSEMISIGNVDYLKNIGEIIKETDNRTQANFVIWIVIKRLIPYMSEAFRKAEHSFKKISTGQDAAKPRWKVCIIRNIDSMGYALSGLFIEQFFEETAKKQVEEIFDLVKISFEKQLSSASWLDKKTRTEALKKLKLLKKRIAYPDFIKDPHFLDKYYQQLEVTDNYFQNGLNLATFDMKMMTSKFGKTRNTQEWMIPPIEFNAYYDRTTNEMVLLAGLLQKPLFSEVFPKSLTFGRIGFIIGHEIIHGFDSIGRHFNSDGNVIEWWSENSISEFNNKSKCFVEQYNSFTVFGREMSGLRTLSENIADNGGLSLAYLGYKEWLKTNSDLLLPGLGLTHEQQFFLAFGQYFCANYRKEKALHLLDTDMHSNNMIRVIGTIQNSEQFANAFKCPRNSTMNPSNKCSLW